MTDDEKTVGINLPEGLVTPIIEAKVKAAIIQQFDKTEVLLDKIVNIALTARVDDRGKSSSYSHDKQYIDYFVQKIIRESTTKAFEEHVEKIKPRIVDAIKRKIRSNVNSIASCLVDGMIESTKNNFNFKVNVEIDKKKDY